MKKNGFAAENTKGVKMIIGNEAVSSGLCRMVQMSQETFDGIIEAIGTQEPEQGGALGMDKNGVVTHFYHDEDASVSGCTYTPSNKEITQVIQRWEQDGIRFCGMIHSHPGTAGVPSPGDMEYAERILAAMPETLAGTMHMPIVTVDPEEGSVSINWFVAEKNDQGETVISRAVLVVGDTIVKESVRMNRLVSSCANRIDSQELFLRNAALLPLDTLRRKTVVVVGCGGARGFCESLARSAVGRFILIDGDTVSATNIATQGTYVDEIGLPKTKVIADTLRRINPEAEVIEIRRFLDEHFSDDELREAIGSELLAEHPEDVLLCGCTDNFAAQDRTVKLALNMGVPYLAAQVYAEGRAAEVVFTYPGVTEACPRCMLASRYRAYESGAVSAVTSECSPIYVTERMNALKSHIAVMQLLYGTDSRIGKEFDLVKTRNLVMMSFSPDCEEQLGISAFSRSLNGLQDGLREIRPMEETVWLEQKPDRPENGYPRCPYCAGTGDLRNVKGLIADTRRPHSLTALIQSIIPDESSSK